MPAGAHTMEVSAVSIDLSTLGSVRTGATVLVANGIVGIAAGEFPCSVLPEPGTRDGGAKGSVAA